jgi:protein gp37
MNKTDIEWTDFTWNPVTGCLHGCPYCYARATARRFYTPEIGFSPHFWPERIGEPGRRRKPAKIFVTSMGDLFGDWVPGNWWRGVFDAVSQSPQHTFQFLTKNPRRLKEMNPWPDNCWAGVTATDQGMFDVAVRHLKEVGIATKFVSAEPLLGPIRIKEDPGLNWLIIGAQTGRRPMQPSNAWVDDLVADAHCWGIKIFCKDNLEACSIREWPV